MSIPLPIPPDFDRDFTLQWGDRVAAGVSMTAYQRYAPPPNRQVCLDQIEALTETIANIVENVELRKQEAILMAEQNLSCDEAQSGLRRAKDAKRRFESARSAYLHWLRIEDGGTSTQVEPVLAVRQQVSALAAAVRLLAETYRADLAEDLIDLDDAKAATDQVLALLDSIEA